MRRTLVLGIGNILLRDEGLGVRVIEAMQAMRLAADIELLDGGTSGADLINEIADREKLIVIDAMSTDAEPGTVFRLGADELLEDAKTTISLHEFGLLDTLMMARHLGCHPKQVVIFGVQPKRVEPGLALSSEVAEVLPRLIELVLAEAETENLTSQDSHTSQAGISYCS